MFRIKLYPFMNVEGDMGSAVSEAPAESVAPPSVEGDGTPSDAGNAPVSGAEKAEDVTKQESFAKRLSEEREKIEKELKEQYKDFDTYKEIVSYFSEVNQADPFTLKDQIDMERLQERAAKEGISPDLQKRLEQLEAKAQLADKLESERLQQEKYREWRGGLEKFAQEREVNADELEKFMLEHKIPNMDAAFKAMNYDKVAKSREEIEKEAIDKFLKTKQGMPSVQGHAGGAARTIPGTPKTMQEGFSRMMNRLNSWGKTEG